MIPTLHHVNPGDKFQPSAATWNSLVDAARGVRGSRVITGVTPFDAVPAPSETTIIFQIIAVDCEDRIATAIVRGVQCGITTPAMFDTITLCDALGCSLLGPADLLVGRLGFAQQMNLDPVLGCATYYDSDPCPWVITGLCPADFSCS